MPGRIGIITIQGDNYGATLQAVALNRFLNESGYDTENIDYNDVTRVAKGLTLQQRIKNVVWRKFVLKLIIGNEKEEEFETFRKLNMRMSDRSWRTKEELLNDPPQYDVYISGSDQIWNPQVINGDYNYLLAFAESNKRKISYASSFGVGSIPKKKKDIYRKFLDRYSQISVREQSGKEIVENLINKNCSVVLDPTLLLKQSQWNEIISTQPEKVPYILCYYMPGDKVVCNAIKWISKQLSKKTGLKIINLGLKEYYKFNPRGDYRVVAGPDEFVSLFLGAEYVITNSFHGTAFAVNFNKKLCVPINARLETKKSRHTRLIDFLSQFEMDDVLLYVDENHMNLEPDFDIDYDRVNILLEKKRAESIDFLVKAIDL